MNKKFKFASAFLSAGLLITPISGLVSNYDNVAKANEIKEKDEIEINFYDIKFKIYNYKKEDINIKYEKIGLKEIATITEKNTNKILEKITVENTGERAANTINTNISRDFYLGPNVIKVNFGVKVYYEGSFRWIGEITSQGMYISSYKTPSVLVGAQVGASINESDPSRIDFSIAGTIHSKASRENNPTPNYSDQFANAGYYSTYDGWAKDISTVSSVSLYY